MGSILLLMIEIGVMACVDRFSFGTWMTPFTMLAFPYLAVVLLVYAFAESLGFVTLYPPSVAVWIGGLLVFWFAGRLSVAPFSKRQAPLPDSTRGAVDRRLLAAAWLCTAVVLYGLANATSQQSAVAVGTDAYEKAYGGGLSGHVRQCSFVFFIYLVGAARRRDWFAWCTVAAMLGTYLAYPVKAWLIIPVMAGLVFRVTLSARLPIRQILTGVVIVYALFQLSYVFIFTMKNGEVPTDVDTYMDVQNHMANYVFSGVLAYSQVAQAEALYPRDPAGVYAPFMNIAAQLTGGVLVDPVRAERSRTSALAASSNVHTLFGTLIMYLGTFEAAVYTACMGSLLYILYCLMRRVDNCWLRVLWSFMATGLAFGWFDLYFQQLAFIEVPAYCAALAAHRAWYMRRRERRASSRLSLPPCSGALAHSLASPSQIKPAGEGAQPC